MGTTSSTPVAETITLREIEPGDIEQCARICFEAFGGIDDHHRFPPDFPSVEFASGMMQGFVGLPPITTAGSLSWKPSDAYSDSESMLKES